MSKDKLPRSFICLAAVSFFLAGVAAAQTKTITTVRHVGFDSPEGWALKYFASATLLSGLQPPETRTEGSVFGSITLGFETGWLPTLSPDRARVGFSGHKEEDLNKAQVFLRPVLRVGLPAKFTVVIAGDPPIETFGITPRIFAFGLERPILESKQWRLGWRGYGQVGSLKSAFSCPQSALGFPAGSSQNPSGCIARSSDIALLRYAGSEIQFAYRIPRFPKISPHLAGGANFVDGVYQVNAPLANAFDHSRLSTHGVTFSGTAGVSYLFTRQVALTVDAFYSPLWVQRVAGGPKNNDGMFNVRALLSYSFR